MVAEDWLEPVRVDQSEGSSMTSAVSGGQSEACGAGDGAVTSAVTSQDTAAARGASDDVGDVGDASVDDAPTPKTDVCVAPPESGIIAVCGNGADAVTMPDSTRDGWPVESGSNPAAAATTGSGSGSGSMRKLKSALKTTTGQGKTERFRTSGIKSRSVRFNEALNTFLECDYVIYVDDDEYDLLYDLSAAATSATSASSASSASSAPVDPATLVNIRSFDLQLPETCVSYPAAGNAAGSGSHPAGIQCVAVINPTSGSGGDQLTLSPPDGYKDALYAAVMETIVDDSGWSLPP